MNLLFKNLLIVFACCSFICGQEKLADSSAVDELDKLHQKAAGLGVSIRQLEERQDALVERLSEIGEKDRAEAVRLKSEVVRLFPCCPLRDEDRELFGISSGYTFRTEKTGDGYFAVSMFYDEDAFHFPAESSNHGFFMSVGRMPLENVTEKLPQFAALAKYRPPIVTEEIKREFAADGLTFRRSVPVVVGQAYLLRAVSYAADGNIDSIFALKVARQDADGSLVAFIKKLKDFPPPSPRSESPKYEPGDIYEAGMNIKIQGMLRDREIDGVRLEFTRSELFVRGTVPKGKAAEVVRLVTELNPQYTVINELNEQ